jgi:hypothetical protein
LDKLAPFCDLDALRTPSSQGREPSISHRHDPNRSHQTPIKSDEPEYLGLAAQSHYGAAGVATGAATLFDRHGPIGTSSALALAQPADAFKPSYS